MYKLYCNMDGQKIVLSIQAKTTLYALYEARDILKEMFNLMTLPNTYIDVENQRWYIC